MGFDSWTCLMVQDGPGIIADEVRTVLKIAACNLFLHRIDEMLIRNNLCTGIIKTDWSSHMVGSRSGILFKSKVESDTGEYSVNFLLNTSDLEKGAETIRLFEEGPLHAGFMIGTLPVEALYEFENLSLKRTLH